MELHTDRPHPARVYNFLLGGDVFFEADRIAAEQGMKSNPASRVPPRENRAFLRRAVRYLAAEQGIDQFLDIGTGIPSAPNVHHVAEAVHPAARVVYVDHDPIVLAHAQGLLDGDPAGVTDFVQADLLRPAAILAAPQVRAVLDFDRPIGLLLVAVLHFVGDDQDPYGIVRALTDALPPGSFVALSHLTGDFAPESWAAVTEIYRRQSVTMRVRSRAQIEGFFDGLELVDPGLRVLTRWRPEPGEPSEEPDAAVSVYGGVARIVSAGRTPR
ncbi:SAM-dependent methyltransferase [Actinoplanes sp. Pm04-4]|uniref:SAM-dependent methyltransferase n=1 Tax=Paractinoplanes pyxinae TaxID=2997416 RepID=A0ABT4BAV7_9ACTN|nr:SAM-dependent methyltransferase [Actinoplanes pyxinae]MCY1143659.1 SAM-dependent methyltransferase [Actinoplanes pyxinae]